MIESIFYFQIFFFLLILLLAFLKRSASLFMLAGVFSLMTAVQISAEGVDYFDGWRTQGLDTGLDDVNTSVVYDTQTVETSGSLFIWFWSLFGLGIVWLLLALVLGAKGREINT